MSGVNEKNVLNFENSFIKQIINNGQNFNLLDSVISEAIVEFTKFIEINSLEKAIDIANDLEKLEGGFNQDSLVEQIQLALDEKRGLDYIRVGDGEGRFIGEARFMRGILKFSEAIAKNVWFKDCAFPDTNFFDNLENAFLEADYIGYNPSFRVNLEAANLWYGYLGVVSGNNFINDNLNNRKPVKNWLHVNLFSNKKFKDILSSYKVTVISCHKISDIDAYKLGLVNYDTIVTPPESNPVLINNCPENRRMYPDVYNDLIEFSAVTKSEVVLVSCGVYAKIICHKLKKMGKIALDIGSDLDKVLGFNTR